MKTTYFDESDLDDCATLFLTHYNTVHGCQFTKNSALLALQEIQYIPRFMGFVLKDKKEMIGFVFAHLKTWDTLDELVIDEWILAENLEEKEKEKAYFLMLDDLEKHVSAYGLAGLTFTTDCPEWAQRLTSKGFAKHQLTFFYKGNGKQSK